MTRSRRIRWTYTPASFGEDCSGLSDEAYRLHVEGLVWSNRRQLDCRVPIVDFRRFSRNEGLGVGELVEAGFWRRDGDSYVILRHATDQPTAASIQRRDTTSRENGARNRRARVTSAAPIPAPEVARIPVADALRKNGGLDWLYRYWDRDGVLLYVGIAYDAAHRGLAHARTAIWWRFVTHGLAEDCLGGESQDRERQAIQAERPLFNERHSPVPLTEVIEYCARREAWNLVDHFIDRFQVANPVENPEGQDRTGRDRKNFSDTDESSTDQSSNAAIVNAFFRNTPPDAA